MLFVMVGVRMVIGISLLPLLPFALLAVWLLSGKEHDLY